MKAFDGPQSRQMSVGKVLPAGWYEKELHLQAEGITGCLDEIWDSVGKNSAWLGGTGENWERGPYYLDGLIPLAWLLEDEKLQKKAIHWMEAALESETPEGSFGPNNGGDIWSRTVMIKAMLQYAEATGDLRIIELVDRYFHLLYQKLEKERLISYIRYRGADLLLCIRWMYAYTGKDFFLQLFDRVSEQLFPWAEDFITFPFTRPTGYYYPWRGGMERFGYDELPHLMRYHETHCVNIAMGLKLPVLLYWRERREYDKKAFYEGIGNLKKYHGVASGIFTGDEHLSGNNPTQGTELCEVVELLYSYYTALDVFDDYEIADEIEHIAFNALPAQFGREYSRHQYLQQANQVLVSRAERNWYNNAPDSNLFGMEPNYGCCTANQHQGWPKLAQVLFLAKEDEICAAVYAPCRTVFKGMLIREETEYPFRDEIHFLFSGTEAQTFTFRFRVPGWCDSAKIESPEECGILEKGWHEIRRSWKDGDSITLTLPMHPEFSYWYHESVAVGLGPLLFAYPVKGEWKEAGGSREYPDYAVYPTERWNYGILPDSQTIRVRYNALGEKKFDLRCPPVVLEVWAKKIESWKLEAGSAGELPVSPVIADTVWERIELVPYGMTDLRISQFPWLDMTDDMPSQGGRKK